MDTEHIAESSSARKKMFGQTRTTFVIALVIVVVVVGGGVGLYSTLKSGSSREQVASVSHFDGAYYVHNSGFKIIPPPSWQSDESGKFGASVFFYNQDKDVVNGVPFTSNMNVVSEPSNDRTLETYVTENKRVLKNTLPHYSLEEDADVIVGGLPAHILGATFTQGKFSMRNVQLFIIKDKRVFVTTATTVSSTWLKYKNIFETSLASFSFPQ